MRALATYSDWLKLQVRRLGAETASLHTANRCTGGFTLCFLRWHGNYSHTTCLRHTGTPGPEVAHLETQHTCTLPGYDSVPGLVPAFLLLEANQAPHGHSSTAGIKRAAGPLLKRGLGCGWVPVVKKSLGMPTPQTGGPKFKSRLHLLRMCTLEGSR